MSISEHEAKVLSDFEAYEAEVATLRARVAELERGTVTSDKFTLKFNNGNPAVRHSSGDMALIADLGLCMRARAETAERERDEAADEAAACVEFLRNLRDWHSFWEEGFLGEKTASASRQNGQAIRAFLDETGHARRVVERLASLERDLDLARGLIARLGDADALESLNALLAHERARVAELEVELDAARRVIETGGQLVSHEARALEAERELHGMRQRARAAEAQRDEAVSRSHESLTESVRAKADAARLREALSEANCVLALAVCGELTTKKHVEEAHKKAEAALASATGAEPTPREAYMRVAEAVALEWFDAAWKLGGEQAAKDARSTIDLAAVVAKAVGT